MLNHHHLPSELWLEILSWAVQPSPKDLDAHAIDYKPFQPAPTDIRDPTLSIKRTLTMVCRLWRMWTVKFLYRDIKIHRGAHGLQHVLGVTGDHEDYGRMVWTFLIPSHVACAHPNHA